ncbi:HAD family hydrolase [Streptomyces sp. NPDC088846]|uniref:HAD family hydrolase n=1 Tax=Streptomyces sp. NPDC088846 TaxID=3365908 RepID=UPI0038272C6D
MTADDVLLVGDTTADVAAGFANRVRVLAVSTGRSTAAHLCETGAPLVLPDLEEAKPLLGALAVTNRGQDGSSGSPAR